MAVTEPGHDVDIPDDADNAVVQDEKKSQGLFE